MIITINTGTSYLSEHNAKSHATAHFYLKNKNDPDLNNGAILNFFSIIKHIMALTNGAELTALFYGCKNGTPSV